MCQKSLVIERCLSTHCQQENHWQHLMGFTSDLLRKLTQALGFVLVLRREPMPIRAPCMVQEWTAFYLKDWPPFLWSVMGEMPMIGCVSSEDRRKEVITRIHCINSTVYVPKSCPWNWHLPRSESGGIHGKVNTCLSNNLKSFAFNNNWKMLALSNWKIWQCHCKPSFDSPLSHWNK